MAHTTTGSPQQRHSRYQCDVSIIIPVHNGEKFLDECLQSVYDQDFEGTMEVSVFNDSSTDDTDNILEAWKPKLIERWINVILTVGCSEQPKGSGYAKNMAINQSTGRYLCILDADDVMLKCRVQKQYEAIQDRPNTIIGSQFYREPEGSTERYTKWANNTTSEQLLTQCFMSHGPTVVIPTWFLPREVFDKVGKFDESGHGTPEDQIFFFEHLRLGGKVFRVDEVLLMYRYHPACLTFSIKEETIFNLRIKVFQDRVLSQWNTFTIWNAGKQGRHFYRSLLEENQQKVLAFCDVDAKKISKGFYVHEESTSVPRPRIPIIHFSQAKSPIVICVKQDLTGGGFEQNLDSLHLKEGTDYIYFS